MAQTWVDPIQLQILIEVAVAMLLGALIGIERELADKPAGLRTHMLVAASSALFVGLGDGLVMNFNHNLGSDVLRSDPVRIIEAIITGISFLGAGTIIRRKNLDVEGLTTAASIIMAAALGVAVAVELWFLAVAVTILTLIVLHGLHFLSRFLPAKRPNAKSSRQ